MLSSFLSFSPDMKDPAIMMDLVEEAYKLRLALASRWINNTQLVQFLDKDRSGIIDYEEFYDGMNQFGLAQEIDLDKVFAFIDKENTGEIALDDLINALKLSKEDANKHVENLEDVALADLPKFPETLLVGLVAHNDLKPSMMLFVKENLNFFKRVRLVTTGSTGRSLGSLGLKVDTLVSSGPLGGDQEIGGMIANGDVAAVFFFQDPLSAHPHKHDIRALNRICCVHNILFASNPSTASALVYALEQSAYGVSHLMGMNPEQGVDSKIVKNYKDKQQQVIKDVSDSNGIKKRASLVLRGSKTRMRGSVLHAPI